MLSHYFNDHLPRAATIADELRLRDGKERYVFLAHVRLPAAGGGVRLVDTYWPWLGAPGGTIGCSRGQ